MIKRIKGGDVISFNTLSSLQLSEENALNGLIAVFCVGVSSSHFVRNESENCEEKHDFDKKCYFLWVPGSRVK